MNVPTLSLHEEAKAVAASNRWPYAYALGYCHGKDDRANGRPREIPIIATDDFAFGYHKGYQPNSNPNPA